ncbi:MAG TPA: PEP/pyruvate-binding domain-containing protein [Syntrophorhabdales bacterium]|nr:PEP/pyruvate-binding domain-containing protein [Syntrophorhabdales bacterium]
MTEKEKRLTIWYDEMDGNDFPLVGKKNANLGEMIKAGIPVAPGFCITIYANEKFIVDTGIKSELEKLLTELGQVTFETAKQASETGIRLIENAQVPSDIEEDILANYKKLCERSKTGVCPVAVRSSGAVSMPGQMETYLNIRGEKDLIDYVKRCWASAYNVEAIMYRMNKGMPFLFNIGVGIPKMVNSRVSGIIFTINPVNGDLSKISIDASCGLGEAVVSGMVTPDTYLVDKITLDTIKTTIGSKETQCVYRENGSDILQTEVPEEMRCVPCLTHFELKELARVGKLIENYYGKPYDIEFGIDADFQFPENIIILQVRPESVWSKKEVAPKTEQKKDAMDRILGQLLTGVRIK